MIFSKRIAGKNLASAGFLVVLAAVKFRRPSVGAGWNLVHNFLMTLNCGDTWTSVSKLIRQRISADAYERWFHGVDVISDDGLKLVFRVPNPIHQFFIERNYLWLVQEAASEVLRYPPEYPVHRPRRGRARRSVSAGVYPRGAPAPPGSCLGARSEPDNVRGRFNLMIFRPPSLGAPTTSSLTEPPSRCPRRPRRPTIPFSCTDEADLARHTCSRQSAIS